MTLVFDNTYGRELVSDEEIDQLLGAMSYEENYGRNNDTDLAIENEDNAEGMLSPNQQQNQDADISEFGVHITYHDFYHSFIFLMVIYVLGRACRWLKMPSLVGEILTGMILGPPLLDIVPNPEAWVKLGELGLVLLFIEAGINIDVATLEVIGKHGVIIAMFGALLPITIGTALALAINGTEDIRTAIAAGATFGPTSLGIAINTLRSGGMLNTPIGQLIVSAGVIDDMIALIVLSQMESLKGNMTVGSVLTPVAAAVGFIIIGGSIALFVVPSFVERVILSRTKTRDKGKVELALMFGMVVLLIPATYYGKASYLVGAFMAGLSFCTSKELHHNFSTQFKRLLQWLMRIFFAASLGFQVPVLDLYNLTVIWQGLIFTLALTGKFMAGFLVPNFTQASSFTGTHLRDCVITGLSMAAEGEFAFVIAVFAVDNGLTTKELYASVLWAVLFSTVVPPFLLRALITYYNRKAEEAVQHLASEAESILGDDDNNNMSSEYNLGIDGDHKARAAVFLCLQIRSDAQWGLIHKIMSTLAKSGMDIIDHRSWHPPGIHPTVVNEIYVKDTKAGRPAGHCVVVEQRMDDINRALEEVIDQPKSSTVKVSRWFPGVVNDIVERYDVSSSPSGHDLEKLTLSKVARNRSRSLGSVDEIRRMAAAGANDVCTEAQKRGSAIVSNGLWSSLGGGGGGGNGEIVAEQQQHRHDAEILVDEKRYEVCIDDDTLERLESGNNRDEKDIHGMNSSPVRVQCQLSLESSTSSFAHVGDKLQGFVRHTSHIIDRERISLESEVDVGGGDDAPDTGHTAAIPSPSKIDLRAEQTASNDTSDND